MKKKFLTIACLMTALILCMNVAQAQQKSGGNNNGIPDVVSVSAVKGGETSIEYTENNSKHRAVLNGSRIVEMYINDRKIPQAEHVKYEAMVKKIMKQLEKDQKEAEKDYENAKAEGQQSKKDRIEINKTRKGAKNDARQAEKDRQQAEAERKRSGQQ